MKSWLTSNRYVLLLTAIAIILRMPGVTDGLPAVYNPTEYFLAKIALGMGARSSPDPLIYIYPPFFGYLLLILYAGYYLFGKLTGLFSDQVMFAVKFLVDPDMFYILGRTLSLAIMILIIWVTFRMIRKYRGAYEARVTAGLITASMTLFPFSTSATPEMLLLLWSLLAVLIYLPLRQNPSLGMMFLAGILAGLAAGTKYNAGALVLAPFLFVLVNREKFSIGVSKSMLVAAAGIVCGFFIPNLHIALAPGGYLNGIRSVVEQMYFAPSVSDSVFLPALFEQLIRNELLLGVLFLVVTIYYLICRFRKEFHLLIPLILTLMIVMSWSKTGTDYLIPVFPVLIIFSGRFITGIIKSVRWQRLILVLIFVPIAAQQCLLFIRTINLDTREQATSWLIETVRPEDRLCYDHDHYDIGVFDIRRFTEYGAGAKSLAPEIKNRVGAYADAPRQVSLVPVLYAQGKGEASGFLDERSKYRRKTLRQLLNEDMTLLMTNAWFYAPYLKALPENYPESVSTRIRSVQNFYRQLLRFEPVKKFEPDFWHKGPLLKIYRFDSHGETIDQHSF